MFKLTVVWDDVLGKPVADANAKNVVKEVLDRLDTLNQDSKLIICNQSVLNEFRIAAIQNKISAIDFEFKGEVLNFNKKTGRFLVWPHGFADTIDNQLNTILGLDG